MDGWSAVETTKDETAYVNPLADSIQDAVGLKPDKVESNGWDVVNDTLSSPEASSVKRVGVDMSTGVVHVEDSQGVTDYVIAAVGDQGSMSLVDGNGNVSTAETNTMPLKHHVALVETVQDLGIEPETETVDAGLDTGWTDIYDDIMESGTYEALDGDVKFTGFDSTRGVPKYESDSGATEKFIDQLEDIAEFYRDFESSYSPSDQEVSLDMPITPERRARRDSYKFRCRGTDRDANIVVSNDYGEESDQIELEVLAFGDHNSDANGY